MGGNTGHNNEIIIECSSISVLGLPQSWTPEHNIIIGSRTSNFSKSKSGTNHTFQLIMTIPTMNFIKITIIFLMMQLFYTWLVSKQEAAAEKSS